MFSPKKILVPTDFSEYSDNALSEAVDIALRTNRQSIFFTCSVLCDSVRSTIACQWMRLKMSEERASSLSRK
jgi:hypothetical protein